MAQVHAEQTCRGGANQKFKSEKELSEMGRGACSVVSILLLYWLDISVIHMASSCAEDIANRWVKKEKMMVRVQEPFSVTLYKYHMGGVDHVDQCEAMYSQRHQKNFSFFGCNRCTCLAPLPDVWTGKDETPLLQRFCSSCTDK